MATVGYNDWVHVARDFHDHKRSGDHFAAMQSYLVRRQQSKCQNTIETVMQRNFNAEVKHWRDVLTRLISFIKFLAEHDIAIRGTGGHECLGDPKNGPFLSLVELVASYVPVLSEHVPKVKAQEISHHYMSKDVHNEYIQLLGRKVLDKIVKQIQKDRYYSLILDCTPDINHEEQMTMII